MSSSTGREQLQKNAGGTTTAFIDNQGGLDLFAKPSGWVKTKNYVEELMTFSANSSTHTRGSSSIIEIDKRADLLGSMHLVYDRAAFAVTNGVNYICAVDWEAYYAIQEITFSYGNKVFWRTNGELLVNNIKEYDPPTKRKNKALMASGDLTPIERQYSAYLAQRFTVDLDVPWKKLEKLFPILALPNKIRIEVFWRPVTELIQTATTVLTLNTQATAATSLTLGTITNLALKVRSFHLPEEEREKIWRELSVEPYKIHFISYERHAREVLTSTTGANTLRLTNFRNDSICVKAYIRQLENVTQQQTLDPFRYLPFIGYLRDNGIFVTTAQNANGINNNSTAVQGNVRSFEASDAFQRHTNYYRQNPMVPYTIKHNILKIPLVVDERYIDSENGGFGSRNLSRYNALELYIDITAQTAVSGTTQARSADNEYDIYTNKKIWTSYGLQASGTSSNFIVDVWSFVHNVLVIGKGDVKSWLSY